MGLLLLAMPIIAVIILILNKDKQTSHMISIGNSSILLVIAIFLTSDVMRYGIVEYKTLGGFFYLDSFSIIVLDIIIIIGFVTSIYSVGYLDAEIKHGQIQIGKVKTYYILMFSFIFTMMLAITVKNMGIMWIAIEATTLASAFLVGFYNNKQAIEAAWKYVIICSVGIAIALLGIVFLHLSSVNIINESNILDWTALYSNASALKSSTLKLAFIFIFIGFGTKAGLAPMHTWLPDAHSQAPSPISALLSGVLLNSAMYGIIRTVSIVNKNLGESMFTGRILMISGFLSIATAAVFIITQKDYKRLLAYSSIEHMGIISLSIGLFTPLSIFGALLHMINHSLTKSMLFLSSGNILQKYNTREISKVKGLLKILPLSGLAFLIGLFAIAGTPPFSVFASELNVIVSVFESKLYLIGALLIILLAAIFSGIALTLFKIFYGSNESKDMKDIKGIKSGETNIPGTVVVIVLLVVICITGIYLPEGLKTLIYNAQRIIIGG
ncbi:MAG TPA: hydrogenase 4 subunit F [Clostridia bacterium]|nr:hydrogenase 4 subunit F [Clostridia bacterium]